MRGEIEEPADVAVTTMMNGRAELVKYLLGLVLAGLVSYFTALGTLQQDVAILKERYAQLAQDIAEMKSDVRLLLRGDR